MPKQYEVEKETNSYNAKQDVMAEPKFDINDFINETNIADKLDDNSLGMIGNNVVQAYDADKQSRGDWETKYERAIDLSNQSKEGREYAGEAIADVKYPAITSAAIQFAARAFPAIVKDDEVVKYGVIGNDQDGQKASRASRVADHMNFLICRIMDNWEEDMDRMLVRLAIIGSYFKKTYYDPIDDKPKSDLIDPIDLVKPYTSENVEKCHRKTQILRYTYDQYVEMVRAGIFTDIGLIYDKSESYSEEEDLITFLEQHTFCDLDCDGYGEPYVITVHKDTQQVVRITARYAAKDIQYSEDGKLIKKIKPREYFTQFNFMPSIDGGGYGLGLGFLLGPLNESINSLFNMLLDAGANANRQGGFLDQEARLQRGGESGDLRFKQGEWKYVQTVDNNLRNAVFPLPLAEPSPVLFQLLGMLMEASRELSAQSELLSGQQMQHNVPATSTLALIEQGLKVFSAVYKRIYISLASEYKKLHRIELERSDDSLYKLILDDENASERDFDITDFDIIPISSSATVTDTQKYIKAQSLMELLDKGFNDQEIVRQYLEAIQVGDIEKIMTPPPPQPPPPDPIIEIERARVQIEAQRTQLARDELELKKFEATIKAMETKSKAIKNLAQAESEEAGRQLSQYQAGIDKLEAETNRMKQEMEVRNLEREFSQQNQQQTQQPQSQGQGNRSGGLQGAMR